MESIERAIACDNQPISGATLFSESRYLTSWVTPDNLEIEQKYKALTDNLPLRDKIIACWGYVAKKLRYKPFITARVSVDGRTFTQSDVWLDPAQVIQANIGNCYNRSILLASLLRQFLSPDKVYVVLGNINNGGHAWVLARLDQDYILETTSPNLSSCFVPAQSADIYDPVVFFNDREVRYFPEKKIHEPFAAIRDSTCVRWLEDYLDRKACVAYI